MEQLEILNQIQTKEQEAKRIVEEAKRKASSMIKEAKFTKRKEILQTTEKEANMEAQKIKEKFQKQAQESIRQIDEEANQKIERIKNISAQNKDRDRDYIVDEVLGLWQLQR